jgi:peptidoglycan/LPS O-acetylase OafA/YrhL
MSNISKIIKFEGYPSIEQKMHQAGGPTSGFDYLRITLAIAVVLWHSLETSYSDETSHLVWQHARGLVSLILPAFFALSGFLVCGSLLRTKSFFVFAAHRILRLVPALSVEIFLSAILLGPLLTTFKWDAYFTSPKFWSYFLNIMGDIHYQLPGLFLLNPTPEIVNKSLWTIPYELECYVGLMVLSLLGVIKRPAVLASMVIILSVGFAIQTSLTNSPVLTAVGPPGRLLVLSFFAGISLYLSRHIVPLGGMVTVISAATSVLLLQFPTTMLLSAFPIALFTISIGMMSPPRLRFLMSGDYSYGLYLFAYPIQQTYSMLFPKLSFWYLNSTFTIVCGLIYAAFSWHFVERPILDRREKIIRRARSFLLSASTPRASSSNNVS